MLLKHVPSTLSVVPMPPTPASLFPCQRRPSFTSNWQPEINLTIEQEAQLGTGGGTTLSWRMSRDDLDPSVERIPTISTAM